VTNGAVILVVVIMLI